MAKKGKTAEVEVSRKEIKISKIESLSGRIVNEYNQPLDVIHVSFGEKTIEFTLDSDGRYCKIDFAEETEIKTVVIEDGAIKVKTNKGIASYKIKEKEEQSFITDGVYSFPLS